MPPQFLIRGPNQTSVFTDITDYFRLYEMDLTMNAEEGSTATSTIRADDPDGTFDYVGHRQFRALETSAAGSNSVMYAGYTAEREWHRGDFHRTGVSRVVDISLTDINTVLSRRIIRGTDGKRPAESDVARMQWAEASSEASLIDDTRYLSTLNPVAMDAVDYRGQYLADVFNDCGNASGKDWFIWYAGDTDEFSLFYDFSDSTVHRSPLRLTNDLTIVDEVWTFAISPDTKLRRDPSRVYSGVQMPYDGGTVYETDADTANTFALSGRDVVMPSYNVKSQAKATARAQRYLADLATEEDVITTTVVLPAEKVNFLMAGMGVEFQAAHLPGYGNATWVRAISRNVRQISEEYYAVTLDLSSGAGAVEPVVEIVTADLGIGSAIYGFDDRIIHYGSEVGASLGTIVQGSTYRLVMQIINAFNSPLTGYDNMQGFEFGLVVGAASGVPAQGGIYTWSPAPSGDTDVDYGAGGINCSYRDRPPVGTRQEGMMAPGFVYTTGWGTYTGLTQSVDLFISGTTISGFYGGFVSARVTLEKQ